MPFNRSSVSALSLCAVLGGCSPKAVGAAMAGVNEGDLACAATISAADGLVTSGRVPADEEVLRKGLVAMMGHLNRWAMLKGLEEPAAMAAVKAERERVLADTPPERVLVRAKACIARF